MLIDVKVPALSESITDGTLLNWHKKPGEFVRRDENLVDLETDKVVLEIVAPKDGVLQEISKSDGERVASEEVIATINDAAQPGQGTPAEKQAVSTEKMTVDEKIPEVLLSPAAKKLVSENNIDPTRVPGTGRDSRVTKADIIHYLETRSSGKKHEETADENVTADAVKAPIMNVPMGARPEKRVPMSRLRARVAERLKDAQNTAAS